MTTYTSDQFPLGLNAPVAYHGDRKSIQSLHAVTALPATAALNDIVNVGWIPPNAVVTGVTSKAQSQLDSGGSPALTLDLGITGTPQLFQAALSTVGRTVAATADNTCAGTGRLYKNTTGAKVLVIATIHAAAATGVAGNLEHAVDYFVEE